MARGTMKRYLSMCLVIVMLLTTLLPVGAYAADDSAIEDTATNYEEPVASELEDVSVELEDQESEQVDDTSVVRFQTMRHSFPASRSWKAMPRPIRKKMLVRMPMR